MKLITLRWLIYTPCWSDPTSGNCRHQKAFMLSRGMPIYLHLPLLLRRDQSSYGMMWLWYYFPHIGGDCRTFNIYGWWLRLGLSQGLGKVTFRCPWVRYIWESIFWIMLTQENMSYYHDWKSFIHQWFGSKKNGMNIYVYTSSSSWDPKEAEHLHAARYLNYATNTVVKSAKLVPTLIISVGEPRGFQGLAWLF